MYGKVCIKDIRNRSTSHTQWQSSQAKILLLTSLRLEKGYGEMWGMRGKSVKEVKEEEGKEKRLRKAEYSLHI